ncbi:hypothetical protein [Flammeovirga pacifica]|uniref:Uncharacterized protein n=1 Tax=Flammeovirga pacifica TaxID=915059 RepID=A0A1S1YTH7_FLAPC|nr:hypothetical protein [Flammeovirga pacifica]OHX64330.1 hypothetical protein NH26_22310 [Flammeovirga pacifica]
MYFEGNISIDPSQLTQIERVKPTKAFKRIFYYLTLGNVSDQIEKETFTAVSILQQINDVLLHLGIDNIVRLSHDGIDFYLDKEGKEGDLKEAFDKYDLEIDHSMSSHYDQLVMVMEHEDSGFKYLLEIVINRTHKLGEYPIEIKVTGLLNQFKKEGKDREKLRQEMSSVFENQEAHNKFKSNKLYEFEQFLNELKMAIIKLMKVDDVRAESKTKMVVPKAKVTSEEDMRHDQSYGQYGVHYGYYGFNDFLFYSMLWSSMSHDNHITVYDTHLESDMGEDIGFYEEVDTTTDYFDDEVETDIEELGEMNNEADVTGSDFDSSDYDDDTTKSDGGSWFDFGGDDGGSDWGSDDFGDFGGDDW